MFFIPALCESSRTFAISPLFVLLFIKSNILWCYIRIRQRFNRLADPSIFLDSHYDLGPYKFFRFLNSQKENSYLDIWNNLTNSNFDIDFLTIFRIEHQ